MSPVFALAMVLLLIVLLHPKGGPPNGPNKTG
jgi:hypothetical protein